jgi:hypothetical protein
MKQSLRTDGICRNDFHIIAGDSVLDCLSLSPSCSLGTVLYPLLGFQPPSPPTQILRSDPAVDAVLHSEEWTVYVDIYGVVLRDCVYSAKQVKRGPEFYN